MCFRALARTNRMLDAGAGRKALGSIELLPSAAYRGVPVHTCSGASSNTPPVTMPIRNRILQPSASRQLHGVPARSGRSSACPSATGSQWCPPAAAAALPAMGLALPQQRHRPHHHHHHQQKQQGLQALSLLAPTMAQGASSSRLYSSTRSSLAAAAAGGGGKEGGAALQQAGGGRSLPVVAAAAASSASAPVQAPAAEVTAAQVKDVKRLQQEVSRHRALYYAGTPEVSDAVFDSLLEQLKQVEGALAGAAIPPGLKAQVDQLLKKSPTKQVGSLPAQGGLPKVTLAHTMLSLAAIPNADKDALVAWGRRLAKAMMKEGLVGGGRGAVGWEELWWSVEPKVDGLAASVVYEDGVLQQMATRGDGVTGEDVTHNAPAIQGLPQQLVSVDGAPLPGRVAVRGEVYLSHEDLKRVNAEFVAAGDKPLANPRNAAAGGLRLLDPAETARRRLSFYAFEVVPLSGDLQLPTQQSVLRWLAGAGFTVNPDNMLVQGFAAAVEAAEGWMEKRAALGYDVDGAVLKLDEGSLQQALGVADTDPRWAVAWKFEAEEVTTALLGVTYTVGRTGQITPVATLAPVQVGGVTVSQATLHNLGLLSEGDYRVGDTLVVRRAGDVIPQVVRVVSELRPSDATPLEIPTTCPSCSTPLVPRADLGDPGNLVCPNLWDCPAQQAAGVQHFVSQCVGKGFGPETVEKLRGAGVLTTVADLFKVTEEDLVAFEGIGPKSAATMLAAIDAARHLPLAAFLNGLGIRGVGKETCKKLGKAYPTLSALDAALPEAPGLTRPARAALTEWFQHYSTRCLLNELRALGVACAQEEQLPAAVVAEEAGGGALEAAAGSSLLAGLQVVVTGTLMQHPTQGEVPRTQVQALLEGLGAKLQSGVSGATDMVVVGDKPGASKVAAAKAKGVRLMEEEEFWQELQARGWDPHGSRPTTAPAAAGKGPAAAAGSPGGLKGVTEGKGKAASAQPSAASPPAAAAGGGGGRGAVATSPAAAAVQGKPSKPSRRSKAATATAAAAAQDQEQQQLAASSRPLVGGLFPEGCSVRLLGKFQPPGALKKLTHEQMVAQLQPAFPGVMFVTSKGEYALVGEGPGEKVLARFSEARRVQQVQVWEVMAQQRQ